MSGFSRARAPQAWDGLGSRVIIPALCPGRGDTMRDFLQRLEQREFGLWTGVVAFTGITLLRGILEGALENPHNLTMQNNQWQSLLFMFLHQYAFYGAGLLGMGLILSLFSGTRITKTLKVALTFMPVILLPPLVDALFFGGGLNLSYLFQPADTVHTLLGLFNPGVQIPGVTNGMRIELGLIFLGSIGYVWLKKNPIRGVLAGVSVLLFIILVMGSLPGLMMALFQRPGEPSLFTSGGLLLLDTQKYGLINLFVGTVLLAGVGTLWKKDLLIRLFRATRPEKFPFYLLVAVGGFLVSLPLFGFGFPRLWQNPFDWLAVLALVLAIRFGYCSYTLFNDLMDLEVDTVNNKPTSIVSGLFTQGEVKAMVPVLALLGALWALCLGWASFLLFAVMMLVAFGYSARPFRTKDLALVATFTQAVVALLGAYLGFSLLAKEKAITAFPGELVAALLVGVTFIFPVKDRTDIQGDARAGTKTLFVLLGEAKGKWITGVLAGLAMALIPLIIGTPMGLVVSIPCGLALTMVAVGKRYREGWMWLIGLVFGIGAGWFYYPKLMQRAPDSKTLAWVHVMRGEQFYRMKNYNAGLESFLKGIDSGGTDDILDYQRASFCAGQTQKLAVAENLHRRSQELCPNHRRLYALWARLEYSMGRPDSVLKVVRAGANRGCYSSELARFAGLALLWEGRVQRALAAFEACASTGGHEGLFLQYLTLRIQNKPCLHYKQKALRMHADPEDAFPFFVYYLFKAEKNPTAARNLNRELLSMRPNSPLGLAFERLLQ